MSEFDFFRKLELYKSFKPQIGKILSHSSLDIDEVAKDLRDSLDQCLINFIIDKVKPNVSTLETTPRENDNRRQRGWNVGVLQSDPTRLTAVDRPRSMKAQTNIPPKNATREGRASRRSAMKVFEEETRLDEIIIETQSSDGQPILNSTSPKAVVSFRERHNEPAKKATANNLSTTKTLTYQAYQEQSIKKVLIKLNKPDLVDFIRNNCPSLENEGKSKTELINDIYIKAKELPSVDEWKYGAEKTYRRLQESRRTKRKGLR